MCGVGVSELVFLFNKLKKIKGEVCIGIVLSWLTGCLKKNQLSLCVLGCKVEGYTI